MPSRLSFRRLTCGLCGTLLFFSSLALGRDVFPDFSFLHGLDDAVATSTFPEDASLLLPEAYLVSLISPGEPRTVDAFDTTEVFGINWLTKEELDISEDPNLSKLQEILTEIQEKAKFLTQFDGRDLLSVPFGIQGSFGVFNYQIGFDNLKLFPDRATLDIVAGITAPFLKGQTLYFAAIGVSFNNRQGLVGDIKLALYQDFVSEVNAQKSGLVFRGYREQSGKGSYIVFDCDGISEMQLDLTIHFNPGFIQPVDAKQGHVKGAGTINYQPGTGLAVDDLSITPFYFKDFTDFAFSIDRMSIDLDETFTTVPYVDQYLQDLSGEGQAQGISAEEWMGFYCRSFQLMIGNEFMTRQGGAPIVIEGNHIIIDDLGFTGFVQVEKPGLIPLSDASLGGWALSVDRANLDILANHFRGFGFGGLLHIPVMDAQSSEPHLAVKPGESSKVITPDEKACLVYDAHIDLDSNYLALEVAKLDSADLSMPMLIADLNIRRGSWLRAKTGAELTIEAFLNGRLNLRGRLGKTTVESPGVDFAGMYISNRAPYFGVAGFMPAGGEGSFGAFGLSFEKMAVVSEDPEVHQDQLKKLVVSGLTLELGNISNGDALTVASTMNVFCALETADDQQVWRGKGLQIEQFGFAGKLPGTEYVRGELGFYWDHEVYQEAFAGRGEVKFDVLPVSLGMDCMFGNTGEEGFAYSYVDVQALLEQGAADDSGQGSAFQVYAMVGGYFKNMQRNELTSFHVGSEQTDETTVNLGGKFPENAYLPTEGAWGIKGGMIAKIGKGAIMGLRLEYEQYPSEGQGVSSRFFMEGLIEVMPKEDHLNSPATNRMVAENEVGRESTQQDLQKKQAPDFMGAGTFGGYIRLELIKDQAGKTFHAALGVHGLVGAFGFGFYGEYYKDPTSWHLFIGKPNPGHRVSIGYAAQITDIVEAGLSLSGYFMIGNSPHVPKQIPRPFAVNAQNQSMLATAYDRLVENPLSNIYGSEQGRRSLSQGNALAFGAAFACHVHADLEFLYVSAGADIGFDLLMAKNAPSCNMADVTDVGINRWYLNGQLYAGLSAAVGLKLLGGTFTIFNAGVAVLVQAAAFNPTWGVGTWEIDYKVLWVQGTAQGVFKFGQPCVNINSSFSPGRIIENIAPSRPVAEAIESTPTTISVNSDFHIDFALPAQGKFIEKLIDFESGVASEEELNLASALVLKSASGVPIPFDKIFSQDDHRIILRPQEMLTPGALVTLDVKCVINRSDGLPFTLNGVTFATDTSIQFLVDPNGIFGLSEDDLAASYPIREQAYFHKDEFDRIALDFGKEIPVGDHRFQSVLSEVSNGRSKERSRTAISATGSRLEQVVFPMLRNAAEYLWTVEAITATGHQAVICQLPFRTSRYATFADKLNGLTIAPVSLNSVSDDGAMPLVPNQSEEDLEYLSGDEISAFLADQASEVQASPKGKVPKSKSATEGSFPGRNYLTRFVSAHQPAVQYPYFSLVQRFIPYQSTQVFECEVDDSSMAQQNANPGHANQVVRVFGKEEILQTIDHGKINYQIYQEYLQDVIRFRELKPDIPAHYADCIAVDVKSGPIPKYIPGKYFLKAGYFIPVFEVYSSSRRDIEFTVVP